VVGVNLALALAVTAGAVPRPGDDGGVHAAAVSEVVDVAAPARQPGDTLSDPAAPVPAVEAAPAEPVATTVPAPKPTIAPPTTKKAPVAPRAAPATTPTTVAPVAAPTPVAQAAPAKVARRTPTAAEVQGAIGELKSRVGGLLLLVSPTPEQINQVGDQVCTAFDNNQSFAQVKATGLSMIPASVTVTPATADWAVRRAVALYCPGHANKLV
jgi:hypothetical protein